MNLPAELLAGAELEVETALSPPVRFSLEEAITGEPSPLVMLLRPRIVVRKGGVEVLQVQRHGPPSSSPLRLALLVLLAALFVLFFL